MNSPLLLDTHSMVWLVNGDQHLGRAARASAEAAVRADALLVSTISFWEIGTLVKRGRLALAYPVEVWRQTALRQGIAEAPVDGEIAIAASALGGLPGDPADRIIAATALVRGYALLTGDERILGWRGDVLLQDARR